MRVLYHLVQTNEVSEEETRRRLCLQDDIFLSRVRCFWSCSCSQKRGRDSLYFQVFPWHFYFMRGHSLVKLTEHDNSADDIHRVSVCVCFLPIHSGHQVRWTYQPGSHRRKVTQDF